jgi:dTDP-4-amino-4,6-dideoxy-D-galactose acyltransferase
MADAAGQWLLRRLPWDSEFFEIPTYRLVTGLFAAKTESGILQNAATRLREQLAGRGSFYAFSMVPAEDVRLFQALTGAGWQLIETRLHYHHPAVAAVAGPRWSVRPARPDEALRLGRVAAAARNPFDRFHADPWIGNERGDALLARYAEAAATGALADVVLVPDEPGRPVDSFLAISDLQADAQRLGVSLSRVLLAAVGPANQGWHRRLLSETLHRARTLGQHSVLMTTQATNRAVIHNAEVLGFRLGAVSHVLACRLSLPQ